MKKYQLLIIVVTLIFAVGLVGCGSSDSESKPFEKHPMPYVNGYMSDWGATSYDGCDDHFDSPYWKPQDVYNMESTDSLTVLPKFETYQQSTEYSCGAATALMVLNHYDNTDYDEAAVVKKADVSDETGVGVDGLEKFFKGIGWKVERSKAGAFTFDWDKDGEAASKFTKWVQDNLKDGTPIMVDWLDWAGHWQAIIGYDTMGTDEMGDDVIIMADPYDTSDHYQDGYFVVPAERFFHMWREGVSTKKKPEQQPWIFAKPK